jgi:metal-responsive CopG/Arc/MetJ family transcriptional regulator
MMHKIEVTKMRATLSIPNELIEDLVRETGAKNKTQAIIQAIEDYLKKKRVEKLLALQGKLDLEENWQEMEAVEMEETVRREEKRWS